MRKLSEREQARALIRGIERLLKQPGPRRPPKGALLGAPMDGWLMRRSALFKRSRELFLRSGGQYLPALLSSQRSLSSPGLLTPVIEYTPLHSELEWRLTDPTESRSLRSRPEDILELRPWVTNLFHEQNHRTLWTCLPPPPKGAAVHRYLNLAESLVVMLDSALGDELGAQDSTPLHLLGITYDPGTEILRDIRGKHARRVYRNYLHWIAQGTYLCLEGYSRKDIAEILAHHSVAPDSEMIERAVARATRLDRKFVEWTNPVWQRRYGKSLGHRLAREGEALEIPADIARADALVDIYRITEATLDLYLI